MAHSVRQLAFAIRTWGGRRPGAGRKPSPGRPRVPHRHRERHDGRCPAHATLRAIPGLPSLRDRRLVSALGMALGTSSHRGFRLLQFSIQKDHLHLLVEADTPTGFARGMQGLAIRVAKAINRVLERRGRVWDDRYHARSLRTPREVRNALVYVLNNWRKHVPGATGLDRCSSGAWFGGWRGRTARAEGSPIVAARTWLGAVGWRRYGLLGVEEGPRDGPRIVRPACARERSTTYRDRHPTSLS